MVCFNCGSIDIVELSSGGIKCKNCDETVNVIHYSCKECNSVWVTFDEIFIIGIVMDKSISVSHRKFDKTGHTMIETIHRCLRCDKMAYEIDDGVFKCSDDGCAFEWEVIKSGKELL